MVECNHVYNYPKDARVVLIIPREGKPDLRKQFYKKSKP